MRLTRVILGTAAVVSMSATGAFSQNQQYHSAVHAPSVGGLRSIGDVGRSSVLERFGSVGGFNANLNSTPVELRPRPTRGLFTSNALQNPITNRFQRLSTGAPIGPSRYGFRQPARRFTAGGSSNMIDPFSTRIDQIRNGLPDRLRMTGPLRDPRLRTFSSIDTPVRSLLDRRNLLGSRSTLAQLSRGTVDSEEYAKFRSNPSIDGEEFPSLENRRPDEFRPSARYEDELERILRKQEADYYARGVDYFRQGKMVRAADCFDVCRSHDRNNARYAVAGLIVAYERSNYNRAIVSLLTALRLAESLEDLRIPVEDDPSTGVRGFYVSGDRGGSFGSTVDRANVRANLTSGSSAGYAQLFLAFFAWLNGEVSTAIHAAEVAESELPKEQATVAKKFRELLIDERKAALSGSPDVR